MNLDHDFVQVSKLSKDQKKVFTNSGTLFSPNSGQDQIKRSSPIMEHFFSPNSSGHLRSDAHQCQIIGGGVADVDHTQTIGRDIVKLLGGYIPQVSAPLRENGIL